MPPTSCARRSFVACHQFHLLERLDVLGTAAPRRHRSPQQPPPPTKVWEHLPREVQEQIRAKGLRLFVVDGYGVARAAGLGRASRP